MKKDKRNAWSSVKLRQCCSEVEQEDEELKSIYRAADSEEERTSQTGVSCQSKDREGSHCRTSALTVFGTRLRTTSGGFFGHGDVNKKKQCNWWCAACVGQYDWRNSNRILVILLSSAVSWRYARFFFFGSPFGDRDGV